MHTILALTSLDCAVVCVRFSTPYKVKRYQSEIALLIPKLKKRKGVNSCVYAIHIIGVIFSYTNIS